MEVSIEYIDETPAMEAICFQSNAWKGTFKVVMLAKDVAPAATERSIASFQKHHLNTYSD